MEYTHLLVLPAYEENRSANRMIGTIYEEDEHEHAVNNALISLIFHATGNKCSRVGGLTVCERCSRPVIVAIKEDNGDKLCCSCHVGQLDLLGH